MIKTLATVIALSLFLFSSIGSAATFHVNKALSHITVKADATGGGFTGTLTNYQASITGDPDTLLPSSAKIVWKFSDLDTKEKKRNKKMLSWLETDTYPRGEFTIEKTYVQTVRGKQQTFALGKIKIHGVSKKIAFPITITKEGNNLTISGKTGLKTTDFKLPIIRLFLVATVDPDITISFSLKGSIK